MGRIQVVLDDNTEKELRKKIPNKKGELSRTINRIIKKWIKGERK
jgi:hypothetical protein